MLVTNNNSLLLLLTMIIDYSFYFVHFVIC